MARQLKQVTLATELAAVEQEIARMKEALKPLEAREDALRESLLNILRTQGVQHVKLDGGATYIRAHKTTLKVTDEVKAAQWASEHNSLKVDTAKAMKILKLTGKTDAIPAGFERHDTEYLSVRGATQGDVTA